MSRRENFNRQGDQVEQEKKSKRRFRAQVSGNLVPVTIRIPAQDRDHLEHLARVNGSSMSEYLRSLLDERESGAAIAQRLSKIESQISVLGERISDKQDINVDFMHQNDHKLESLKNQMVATSGNVEQFTALIQGSFEQLFEAFFKLQGFIEHMLKAQGGRR